MKLLNPITPSNRHRSILIKKDIEKFGINNLNIKLKNYSKKRYIEGIIINKNKNKIEIDAGLERIIKISEKELKNINKRLKKESIIGDNIKLLIYKNETKKGDQLLNSIRFYRSIISNKRMFYRKYKLLKLYLNKKTRIFKAIMINTLYDHIGIGMGGIMTYIKK